MERELNKKEYKNADTIYRDKYLELYVQTRACEDLLKFAAALDHSLKYFHRERMESINAIIRELWNIVYKGNDVDTIEIRTDETGDALLASDKKRSYSYRVVMRKKDVEMDMRGRCSAGQKMLASLIIRIALAETFSAHCGIFALDEPTTNLDSANSISLSEALAEIVKRRSTQKNFQLIVITHDKEFSEYLAKEDGIGSYYLVSRDSEGKSRISRQEI
ncbi:hypothetical protein J437_LFUL007997 [Ladona fulva]|uniref:DNA repair protein RAD50 n=1 Tax=Ladona fulva TaxID=123851 RepID=A0A8K0K5N0_LADFU|nr:hypothetical protein J437_LFUL007997 [Ladona fulva]